MPSSSIYTKRFLLVGNGTGTLAVAVPVGVVWVIRDISLLSRTGAVGDVAYIALAGIAIIAAFRVPAVGAYQTYHWDGRQVAKAGESVAFGVFQGTWDAAVSGYEFTV